MDHKDLTEVKASIEKAVEEKGFTVLDLAAAFMQMNMGDIPEEIEEEKPYPEKGRREADGDRRGRGGRDFGRRESGRKWEERYSERGRSGRKREEGYLERDRDGRRGKGDRYKDAERFGRRESKYTDPDRGKKRSRQGGKKALDDKPLGRFLSKRK